MALRISVQGTNLDLPGNLSLQIDLYSPIFNTLGSQSMTVTVPGTPKNLRLLGHPERLDNVSLKTIIDGTLTDGPYVRSVKINILSASDAGIELSFGTDESLLYSSWNDLKLRDIPDLPVYTPSGNSASARLDNLITLMNSIYKRDDDDSDFRVFPVALEYEPRPEEATDKDYPKFTILNDLNENFDLIQDYPYEGHMHTSLKTNVRTIQFGSDDEGSVQVPKGYGVSPFLRVGPFLHLLFSSFGYTLEANIFDTDPQLKQLVMLNNTMDAICTGTIYYRDLLPDCTVNDFLESLKARFGVVVFLNSGSSVATLRLLKDIFSSQSYDDITQYHSARPSQVFSKPTRLVLKLNRNYANASTGDENLNFHEFLAKYGDYYDFADGNYIGASLQFDPFGRYFSRYNQATYMRTFFSSLFFDWDTKEKDYDEFSLSGKDMSLPLFTDPDHLSDLPWYCHCLPLYLSGVRNAHTAIKDSTALQTDDSLQRSTDLCFCFAHGLLRNDTTPLDISDGVRYGSPFCADADGEHFIDSDGNSYIYSLQAVGNDGSYNRFFREFDIFLRAANSQLSVKRQLGHSQLNLLDLSRKQLLFGQPLITDHAVFSFPLTDSSLADFTMRTLRPMEPVPDMQIENVEHPAEYWFVSSNMGEVQQRLNSSILNHLRTIHQSISNFQIKFIFGERTYFSDVRKPTSDECDEHTTKTIRYKIWASYIYEYNDSSFFTPIDKGTCADSEESVVTETWEARRRSIVREPL